MTTQFTWNINSLTVMPVLEDKTDVVVTIGWTLTGVEDAYTSKIEGLKHFNIFSDSFTPFEDLTESQVINWLKDEFGDVYVNGLQNSIESKINELKSPPIKPEQKALPWIV